MAEAVGETEKQLNAFQTALAGRYAVIRELGRGGMATVYLAEDIANGRQVAVKLLLPDLGASIGSDRFLREIEVGTLLQHPNIVGVLDSGDAAGQLYYVMPYIEGKSLRDRIDAQSQLPIDEAIDIIRQVGEALDFAHARGVIHRDIKPENILLDGKRAMLADFGIARAVSVAGGETLTKTGMTVGTPTYMSPEQALGSKDVTAESDIYSLACVLYQLLAGQPPFTGPTAMALLARHSLDNVPSLKIVRNTIPDAVEDAIIKAMAKVPADRFHTAAEFVAALSDEDGAAERRRNSMRAKERDRKATTAAPRKRALLAGAVAVPVLALSVFAGKGLIGGDAPPAGLSGEFAKQNIAVLYFDDGSPNKDLAFVADGLTESLIQELSGVEQLKVISRNGVRPYRNANVTTDSLARALKIGTLVTGKVAQFGDKMRVDMELVDALSGDVIATRKIEQPRDQLIALQDSVAKELSEFLRRRVGGEIARLTSRIGTKNSQAWEALQRAGQTVANAESLLASGATDAAARTFASADEELASAEALDASWPEPMIERGRIALRQVMVLRPGSEQKQIELIGVGMEHANRALQKQPQNADALALRGELQYISWRRNLAPNPEEMARHLAGAEADFKAATVADKLQAGAWASLAHVRFATSRTTEGKLAADAAYRADPYLTSVDVTISRLFGASLDLNLPQEARNWCDEGRRRFPGNYRFAACRLQLFSLKTGAPPKVPEIWQAYEEYVAASPPNRRQFDEHKGRMFVAIALLRAGLPDSAKAVAKGARAGPQIDPQGEMLYYEAIVHAQSGDADEAIRFLRRYVAANPSERQYWAQDDTWWFDDIRDDPRYKALGES